MHFCLTFFRFFCRTNFRLFDGKTVTRPKFRYVQIEILLIFVIFHPFPVSGYDSFSFFCQVFFKSFSTVKVPCSEVPVVPRTAWKTFLLLEPLSFHLRMHTSKKIFPLRGPPRCDSRCVKGNRGGLRPHRIGKEVTLQSR